MLLFSGVPLFFWAKKARIGEPIKLKKKQLQSARQVEECAPSMLPCAAAQDFLQIRVLSNLFPAECCKLRRSDRLRLAANPGKKRTKSQEATFDMTTLIFSTAGFKRHPRYPFFSWLVTENPFQGGSPLNLKTKVDVSKVDVKGFPTITNPQRKLESAGSCRELFPHLVPAICQREIKDTVRECG